MLSCICSMCLLSWEHVHVWSFSRSLSKPTQILFCLTTPPPLPRDYMNRRSRRQKQTRLPFVTETAAIGWRCTTDSYRGNLAARWRGHRGAPQVVWDSEGASSCDGGGLITWLFSFEVFGNNIMWIMNVFALKSLERVKTTVLQSRIQTNRSNSNSPQTGESAIFI